jgi:tRNA (guanine37-N1)-methyltransferase
VREVSIGDYVLAGGEVASLVMIEAITRLIPGILGNPESVIDDSFSRLDSLVEGPVFTKPPIWRGLEVPEVLRSGNHGRVAQWRKDQAQARTETFRPDLLSELPEPPH